MGQTPTAYWALGPKSLPLFTDRLPLTTLLTELPTDARASPYIYDLADLSNSGCQSLTSCSVKLLHSIINIPGFWVHVNLPDSS